VILKTRAVPLVSPEDEKALMRVVKAGFVAKRKKLRSSISAGLAIDKLAAEELLRHANVNPDDRAEDLSIDDWLRLAKDAV
jgi:16S rRNA (adenine1518-N6/adenine1519-N6)-dimethyltransferase